MDDIKFGTINEDGTVANERSISRSSIAACPHVIFMPDHYREDGACRCDDPDHVEMAEWGYVWRDGLWRGEEASDA